MSGEIIIYGTGMAGKLVYYHLLITGQLFKLKAFAVSDSQNSDSEFMSYPVYKLSEVKELTSDAVIIAAAFPNLQNIFMANMDSLGLNNYLCLDAATYNEYCKEYIEYKKSIRQDINDIDILFFPSDNNNTSGAFLSMVDLISEGIRRGLKCFVVLPEYGNGEEILESRNIPYQYVQMNHWCERKNSLERTWQDCMAADQGQALKEIEDIIERHKVKIVHMNTAYSYLGAAAAHRKKIPVIWHIRENIKEQGYRFKDENDAYGLINMSQKIVGVSNYVLSCYPRLLSEKTQVIYNGIERERFYRKREILKDKTVNIIMVGAICDLKGQMDLIQAARLLQDNGILFHISLIGKGDKEYTQQLERFIADNGLEDRICFEGTQSSVEEFYWRSDIAVVSSKSEAFGRVTVEGMISGCIVIGADKGATTEIIEDNKTGYIYARDDSRDLCSKIMMSIREKEKSRKIASYAQEWAYGTFGKENCASKLICEYSKICGLENLK